MCLSHALQQLSVIKNSNLSEFCGIVTATELSFLLNIYRRLYNDCSNPKEHYLQFQLKWHTQTKQGIVRHQLASVRPLTEDVVQVRSQ